MRVNMVDVEKYAGIEGAMSVSGEIIRVFPKKSGDGEFGPWSFQRIILKDETGEGVVLLKNRSEDMDKTDVGRFIEICSKETAKGNKGVKIEKDSYTDKKTGEKKESLDVVITGAAVIEDTEGKSAHTSDSLSKGKEKEAKAAVEAIKESSADREIRLAKEADERKAIELEKWLELKQIRKESIQESYSTWLLTVMESKVDITPEVVAALIRAAGPNADTLFLSKVGRR